MTRKNATTIKDIAQQLKMAPSTVSRALRGSHDINPATRLLVQQVAADLHYTPNPIALSLKEKRSKIIGVVVPEIANNFCAATIAGIEDYAYRKGYHVMIFQSHEEYEREVANVRLLASRRIDGLIISLANNTRRFDHLEEMDTPVVMFDRVYEGLGGPRVVVNDHEGAFRGVEHLLERGCRKIAILSMAPWLSTSQKRLQGYRDALEQYNIPVREEWIVQSCETEAPIEQLFTSGADQPDALFFSMERLAIMSLQVLKKLGLRIPEEVALAGFSDNPASELFSPALTTIRQPTFEIGRQAAELLIAQIDGIATDNQVVQLSTILDVQASSLRNG
ncbi:LacI family transcriptional regulator [Chitinophaga alhagiae]|uniref:LacI family transcriptional regulator n=1 Tax=Chitinophaga alhagiae TaxID=2203219 RepID=A0ABM6WCA9_9BACT|nr:LacI family DNA-binding transcriptional regulator [Chitinophaga alhagiae]AWO01536.1 LacI family transcriptional regulator [Chitinophaga alhagiae]